MPENTSSPSQKGRIFISYRRIDTSYAAGRIYDRLVANFGEDAIFMDVDTIEGGTDFVKVLEDAVQSCDVLIALIGKQWLDIKDKGGKPRLDNPEDFVRIEIATALKRNIRVIPVLVDGVDMPQPIELPENLKALVRRNALQVNHHSFNPDVYRLIEHTKSALDEAEELRVVKAQALQAAREKAEREAAEKLAQEKARLDAEELARQKAAKEKAEREAAEKIAREKEERDAIEKARLTAEELERQRIAKEQEEREAAERIAREKKKKEADEKARVEAEELERQRIAREKAEQDAAAKALLKTTELEKKKVTSEPVQPRKEDTKKSVDGFLETHPWLFMGGLLITLVVLCWVAYQLGADLISPKATETAFNVTNASPTHAMTATLFFTPTKTITPALSKTPTATPYPTEITDAKGVSMVLVPAGSYIPQEKSYFGIPTPNPYFHEDYYIDKYEVTNKSYKDCVDSGYCVPPINLSSMLHSNYFGNSEFDDYPVIFVSTDMSSQYCEWRSSRLPSSLEWQKAALSTTANIFPWGNEISCELANYDNCIGDAVAVGSYKMGESSYGIMDLSGNVWEWVYYLDNQYFSIAIGGSWMSPADRLEARDFFVRSFAGDSDSNNQAVDIGFRCAKDVNQ